MNSCNDYINRNSEWFEWRPQVIILDLWAPRRDSEALEPHRSVHKGGEESLNYGYFSGEKGEKPWEGCFPYNFRTHPNIWVVLSTENLVGLVENLQERIVSLQIQVSEEKTRRNWYFTNHPEDIDQHLDHMEIKRTISRHGPPVQSSGECVSCIHPITLQVKQLLVNQTSGAEWAEARGKSSMKNTRAEQFGCAKSAVSCPCLLWGYNIGMGKGKVW